MFVLKLQRSLLIPVVAVLLLPTMAPAATAVANYDEPVWFNWSKKNLDILILDIHDPLISYSIQRAIQIWQNGISYWNPTLGSQLSFRIYWADSGTVPPSDFTPDIVFVPQGFMSVTNGGNGSALTPTCYATAPMLVAYGSFLRVTTHEFGHCLGQSHVFTSGVEYKPSFDIMGDGDGPKCPSNLNVQVITRAFSGLGGTVSIAPSAYAQAPTC
ncbi:MAG: hypothetical protein QOD77_56 [Thermoplasmata archaeon]|nr:hypothetical protein [Thermoplasmata archaeon]